MSISLTEVFNFDNLNRAWRWIRTSSEVHYKNYFRDVYSAYAIADKENLQDLSIRLDRNIYIPQDACKIYFPKKSGILRPYTLLTIEDQIVYQAFANIIAEELKKKEGKKYKKIIFGNLYAGKRNQYFYYKWQDCYKKYCDAIRNVFNKKYKYAATFDLTACYDSLDHKVIKYFLEQLNFSNDFINKFLEFLAKWSKPFHCEPIFQGHGIPQGPIASGIISELVLKQFDEVNKNRKIKYFRYVDDIRVYAKDEYNLRHILVELDLISKTIGLFPQTSKINIHKVTSIEEEFKSISNPPEPKFKPIKGNQRKIRKRLIELSLRYRITDETRFKYVLGQIIPNKKISKRLLKLIRLYPHLYSSILRYFTQYNEIPDDLIKMIQEIFQEEDFYFSFRADILRTIMGKIKTNILSGKFISLCKNLLKNNDCVGFLDLKAAALSFLIHNKQLSYSGIQNLFNLEISWFVKNECLKHTDLNFIGPPSYASLLNIFLNESCACNHLAIISANLFVNNGLNIQDLTTPRNLVGEITLKKFGLIERRSSSHCGIKIALKEMLGKNPLKKKWKTIYQNYYNEVERRMIIAKGYYKTDPNAWVNTMDTINEFLLEKISQHDTAIGTYHLGNIGSFLNSNGRFARNYPKLFIFTNIIHEKRLESDLSHPKIRNTVKYTKRIKFSFLSKAKKMMLEAYTELDNNW